MLDRSAAEQARTHDPRRTALLRSLARVSKAIAQWARIAQNEQLPRAARRRLRRPAMRLESCEELRRLLLDELACADAAPLQGAPARARRQPKSAGAAP